MAGLERIWTPQTRMIADLIAGAGGEVRTVGGPVRDTLLGLKPKDFDLCTDARPLDMLRAGAQAGIRTFPTLQETEADPLEWTRGGLKHGTVPFVVGDEVVEVTTLRRDAVTDGRHAEIEFVSDFREDAARRDFTFNAMSVDRSGRLYDYFGGEADLREGIVRFVGNADERIQEDYLRILRYYRFRGRYAPAALRASAAASVEAENADAIRRNASGLRRISGERIWQEMARILAQPDGVAQQFTAMVQAGVASEIGLPSDPAAMQLAHRAAQSGARAEIVTGFLLAAAGRAGESGRAGLPLAERWRLSTPQAALIETARAGAGLLSEPFSHFLRLAMEPRTSRANLAALLEGFGRHADAERIRGPLPEFPLRGADLVEAGLAPGPELGRTLADLREAWCTRGYVDGREALLALLPGQPPSTPSM